MSFVFLDNRILIYNGYGNYPTNSIQYEFTHKLHYNLITSLEVWDDLDTIKELTFHYENAGE